MYSSKVRKTFMLCPFSQLMHFYTRLEAALSLDLYCKPDDLSLFVFPKQGVKIVKFWLTVYND